MNLIAPGDMSTSLLRGLEVASHVVFKDLCYARSHAAHARESYRLDIGSWRASEIRRAAATGQGGQQDRGQASGGRGAGRRERGWCRK